MSVLQFPKMFFSAHEGWDDIARVHPNVAKLFALLVIPMAAVPPLMLNFFGDHVAKVFPISFGTNWSVVAPVFFVAELLTVPLMAWAIAGVARGRGVTAEYHDAFTLAAIAPIPMWLSSLVLFSTNGLVILSAGFLGLIGSVALIFRGVEGILRVRDKVVRADITLVVSSLGLMAWALLIFLGLAPVVGW